MDVVNSFGDLDKLAFEINKKLQIKIKEAVDSSLHQSHIFLLRFIRSEGQCIVTDIAKYLGITLSAVTSLVNKLNEMGLVIRVRSEDDRRVVLLNITKEGREVLNKVDKNIKILFQEFFSDLSQEELHIIQKVVIKLRKLS